jgi:type I restriction enzyme M protein
MHTITGRETLGRYFTSSAVGSLLVSAMSTRNPGLVVDLGAGSGSLSAAALRRWRGVQLVTVDIDSATQVRLPSRERARQRHRHVLADALAVDLPTKLGIHLNSVGAGVCNPPYIRTRWCSIVSSILEDACLIRAIPPSREVGAEIVFLAQNLRLLRPGGELGLVVPDGLVSAEKFAPLRRLLIDQHRIRCVISLPPGAFVGTEARAHILVAAKGIPSKDPIDLLRLDRSGLLSAPIKISPEQGVTRLDFDYFEFRSNANPILSSSVRLGQIPHSLTRGSISSSEARDAPHSTFHTCSFPRRGHSVRLRSAGAGNPLLKSERSPPVTAQSGDILLARVDRRLDEKICVVSRGSAPITDCVFRLRLPVKWRRVVLESLVSETGRRFLRSISHGAGASHISKNALQDLPVLFR